jgi:tetratricopeptide (TPR) repeat protein
MTMTVPWRCEGNDAADVMSAELVEASGNGAMASRDEQTHTPARVRAARPRPAGRGIWWLALAPPLETSDRSGRADWWWAGAVGATALGVYVATLPPSITFEDSGEFVTAAATLGIPHAPGYPLYTLLAHLFAAWPFGEVSATAWRVNLFSAVAAALGVAVLSVALRALGLSRPAASAGALAAGLSRTLWSQAIVAEVYSLGFLLLALTLLALTRFDCRRDQPSLAVICLLSGLGVSNHYLFALCIPAIAAHVVLREPRALVRPRWVRAAALAFSAGLLPFLYLPIRSAMDPLLDWGNPETWGTFWYLVRRQQFAGIENPAGVQAIDRLRHVRDIGANLAWIELTPPAAPLMGLGVVRLVLRNRVWGCSTTLMFLTSTIGLIALVGFHYDPSQAFIFRVYAIQAYAIGAIWAAVGLDSVVRPLARALPALAPLGALLLPAAVGAAHFGANDLRQDDLARRHASAILRTLPPDAIVIGAAGDAHLFPLLYAQVVERERPDVTILDDFGLVFNRWEERPLLDRVLRRRELNAYRARIAEIADSSGRPVFHLHPPEDMRSRFEKVGMLYRKRSSPPSGVPPMDFASRYADILRLEPEAVRNDMGRFVAGSYHLQHALALASEGRDREASAALERAWTFSRGQLWLLEAMNPELNRAGRFDAAERALTHLVRLAPHRGLEYRRSHHLSRMQHYHQLGDIEGMEREARAAHLVNRNHRQARAGLAEVLFMRAGLRARHGLWSEALPDYAEARALGHDAAWTGSLIGVGLVRTGRVDEGLAELRRAAAERPHDADIQNNLTTILRQVERAGERERDGRAR